MSAHDSILDLRERMGRSIIGQEQVVERLLLTLLCNGNLLLEGLPGLAKTRAVKSLAQNLETDFSRIQFTPDLLPSDITGAEMYLGEDAKERFEFQPGPIFANIVLADEVNRAPAKVQAALLEAMEERQITVATTTHQLPPLFMVMATQNPIEQDVNKGSENSHVRCQMAIQMLRFCGRQDRFVAAPESGLRRRTSIVQTRRCRLLRNAKYHSHFHRLPGQAPDPPE